jgi:hypothetical protein
MNRTPARRPAFLVVASLSLASAWSTGAFEADLAERAPAAVDRVALLRELPDCLDAGGPRRALCIYPSTLGAADKPASTRPAPPSGRATPTIAPMRPAAVNNGMSLVRLQDRPA